MKTIIDKFSSFNPRIVASTSMMILGLAACSPTQPFTSDRTIFSGGGSNGSDTFASVNTTTGANGHTGLNVSVDAGANVGHKSHADVNVNANVDVGTKEVANVTASLGL